MKDGNRFLMAMGSIALLCGGMAASGPALAGEEVVHRTPSWLTECSVDEKTRERNCSIWRSLASPELDSDAPDKLVFVINAVDDYGFVGSAPYTPASIAIDGNPAVALKQCLAPTLCMLEDRDVAGLRRQLDGGTEMILTVRGRGGGTQTVTYDLAGYQAAASAAKQWLSQP
jgi:hypothetical protein